MSASRCTHAGARRALLVTVLVIVLAVPAAAATAWLAVALPVP